MQNILSISVVFLTAVFCTVKSDASEAKRDGSESPPFAKQYNEFAIDFYQQVAQASSQTNLCISPFGMAQLLGMTYLGSDGATAKEIASVLRCPSDRLAASSAINDLLSKRDQTLYQLDLRALDNDGYGLKITEVIASGPAYKAGVRANDLLLAIDGSPVRTESEFANLIDQSSGIILVEIYQFSTGRIQRQRITLRKHGSNVNRPVIAVCNGLWFQQTYDLKPEFIRSLSDKFQAAPRAVDFSKVKETTHRINKWVAEETNRRIDTLFDESTKWDNTRVALINTLHFKALWAIPFDAQKTKTGSWRIPGRQEKPIPLMRQAGKFMYGEAADCQVIELPYSRSPLSMVVLLPSDIDGLARFEKSLTCNRFTSLISRMKNTAVDIRIPRFNVTQQVDARPLLVQMGISSAFDRETANLSRMTTSNQLMLSSVVQNTRIEVDEVGTTASSATGATAVPRLKIPVFLADHPFVFAIRDRSTNAVLLMGRVHTPK